MLVMRDQLTEFTQRSEERTGQLREELSQQIDQLKKKIIVGQGTSDKKEFVRTRASGVINSSASSIISDRDRRGDHKAEIEALRKEVLQLKKESGASELVQTLNDKIVYVEDRLQNDLYK